MRTLISAMILLMSLSNAIAQAPSSMPAGNAPVALPSPVQPMPSADQVTLPSAVQQPPSTGQSPAELNSAFSAAEQRIGDLEDQARETALVVPGPNLKPEALAGLTEDMTVMCRIFDKALYPSARLPNRYAEIALLNRLPWRQTARTQGLYLDGYGAIFFVQVDFPLVAPQQQKQEAKPEESADRVWSQTIDELRGQEPAHEAPNAAPAYDAQRVDNLKTILIKTLRHAANLRLRPEDQVTVVAGTQSQVSRAALQQHLNGYLFSSARRLPGPMPTGANRADKPAPDPAATLVLRAVKSDVDALAAGKLTADQFAPKVATLWSWLPPQAPEPAGQPPTTTPAAR